jgi:hypothetical protein
MLMIEHGGYDRTLVLEYGVYDVDDRTKRFNFRLSATAAQTETRLTLSPHPSQHATQPRHGYFLKSRPSRRRRVFACGQLRRSQLVYDCVQRSSNAKVLTW